MYAILGLVFIVIRKDKCYMSLSLYIYIFFSHPKELTPSKFYTTIMTSFMITSEKIYIQSLSGVTVFHMETE